MNTRFTLSTRHIGTALAMLACAGTLPAQRTASPSPRELVARAVAAMGGESALRAVRGAAFDFYGYNLALGQEETPASPARANVVFGRYHHDYANGRRVGVVEIRTPTGAVNRSRRITASGIGMLDMNGRQTPDQPGTVAGEQTSLRRVPERLLLAALDNAGALTALPSQERRGEPADGVRYASGPDTLALWFDRRTGLLLAAEALTDDAILGDRRTVTWYTRWQPAGGVLIARQYDVEVNGRLQTHAVYTAVTLNPDLPDSLFAIPDSIAQRASPASPAPPPVTVTLAELAPGVWRAEGGSHHSLVVDQPGGLVVVEAPQQARRFNAVLDTLKARFPGKAVSLVVNTHHHWDHAGGVRAALAAGLSVATHERNAAFVRGIGAARKTVAPDAISRAPREPVVRAVGDSLVVGTGERRVVLYELRTAHCEGMLAAYVPSARLLFTSDVLSPGPNMAAAGSTEVAAFARARGLTIERVAGGHGGVAAWAEVTQAATSAGQ